MSDILTVILSLNIFWCCYLLIRFMISMIPKFSTLQFKKNPSHFRNVLIVCVPRVTCTARSFLEEEGFGGGGLVKLHPFCPGFIPIDDDLLTLEMPTFFKWELYFLYCVSLLARIYSYLYLANKNSFYCQWLGQFLWLFVIYGVGCQWTFNNCSLKQFYVQN